MSDYRLTNTQIYNLEFYNQYLKDGLSTEIDFEEVRAVIASGNYFVTLATRLDEIKNKLSNNSKASTEVVRLEELIKQLLYVQSSYKLKSKKIV